MTDLSKYDFRLLEVMGELYAMADHLQLIESHIGNIQKTEHLRVAEYVQKEHLCPDDPEWQMAIRSTAII